MGAKSGILGNVAVQAEDSAGAATGSILALTGIREFENEPHFVNRQTKVNIWRQETEQSSHGLYFTGRFDCEAEPCAALDLLLQQFFYRYETASVAGGTRNRYRPRRAGDSSIPTIRFLASFPGGPWVTFSSVMLSKVRFTIHAQAVTHVSCEWIAGGYSETDVDPVWTIVRPTRNPLTSRTCTATIDAVDHAQLIEASIEFASSIAPANLAAAGNVSRFARSGATAVTGSLNEFYGDASGLAAKVRGATAFAFEAISTGLNDVGQTLKLTLPIAVPQSGAPNPIGTDDITDTVAFRADHSTLPTIEIVIP